MMMDRAYPKYLFSVSEFLNFLKVSKNYSPNTLLSYENDLNQLCKFLSVSYTGKSEEKSDEFSIDLKKLDINI